MIEKIGNFLKVLLKQAYAGPHGACAAGGKLDLPEAHARSLIEGGLAEEFIEEIAEEVLGIAPPSQVADPNSLSSDTPPDNSEGRSSESSADESETNDPPAAPKPAAAATSTEPAGDDAADSNPPPASAKPAGRSKVSLPPKAKD
jgi:hypothetical protein